VASYPERRQRTYRLRREHARQDGVVAGSPRVVVVAAATLVTMMMTMMTMTLMTLMTLMMMTMTMTMRLMRLTLVPVFRCSTSALLPWKKPSPHMPQTKIQRAELW